MNPLEFLIRIVAGLAVFIFMVVLWAFVPYLDGVHFPNAEADFYAPVLSIFFGTKLPQQLTVLCFLLSRACFGMTVFSWILIPSFQFLIDADFRPLARAGVIFFMGGSVIFFMGGLIVHIFYYGGGTLFA